MILSCAIFFSSCETTELEILDSPNALTPSSSDVDFFINAIQTDTRDIFTGLNTEGMDVTRMTHFNGPEYLSGYGPANFNLQWLDVFSNVLSDSRSMIPLAEEQGLFTHIGVAQILEAYAVSTMVDFFGDVPYSESNDPEILFPSLDNGEDVYNELLNLLDEAIVNLNREETSGITNDLYYGGDESKWIRLANTLKIKLHLNLRLVDPATSTTAINEIIASGDYIISEEDDFEFQYSTTDNDPDSRHPDFIANYDENGVAGGVYMSNYYMTVLNAGFDNKTIIDPRLRYYIYRQGDRNAMNTTEQDCFGGLPPAHYGFDTPFCNTDFPGYWGRDHGNASGIPPDQGLKATWGLYPAGGLFDGNQFIVIADRTLGTSGAGISPIMLSSYVDFMLAEASLELGTTGNAIDYLTSGIQKSMDKVLNFRTDLVDPAFASDATDVSNYIAEITANYTAGSDADRLNIIGEEYFLALFGNGIESYNLYRRTGAPNNVQPLLVSAPGVYLRSFFYPSNEVDNNPNIIQKDGVTNPVFWDTNPDSLTF